MLSEKLLALVEGATDLKKISIGRLISLFENSHTDAIASRRAVIEYLEQKQLTAGKIIGFTGTPGAGKSTLIGELALGLIQSNPKNSVAVLAVDPSSQITGGAFLGDRTRVNFPAKEKRLFFRSQASNCEFGGVSFNTFQVVRVLRYFFSHVFIETVGIGQTEIEIQKLAQHTCLVMQPLAGDQIQFMKSGIMEIPDTFIVNKCDEEALAKRSYHLLKSSLNQAKLLQTQKQHLFMTSALKKTGVDQLLQHIEGIEVSSDGFSSQESFYLEKWFQEEYGRHGFQLLNKSGIEQLSQLPGGFEEKQDQLRQHISKYFG